MYIKTMRAVVVSVCIACVASVMNAGEIAGVDMAPNNEFVSGAFTPEPQTHVVRPGVEIPIGAFRGRDCGQAPDFAKLMEQQIQRGMVIPEGITIYNAGVTEYKSRSCNGMAKARLVGVRIASDFTGDAILIFRFENRGKKLEFPKTLVLGS